MSNAINPEHYNRLNPQPKDVIRAWGLNFNLGSAVKYISRAGHKDDIVQDLKKAQEFIQFEIDAIKGARAERKEPPVHPNCKCAMKDKPKHEDFLDAMLNGLFMGSVGHIELIGKRNGKTDEEIAEIVDKTLKDIISGMAGVELEEIKEGSAEKMVKALIKSNHMAMLEHYSFSVKFICDRGVSHEIVRHRVASYAQESTRYCNYNKSGDVAFILPIFFEEDTPEMDNWVESCMRAEKTYNYLISEGRTPQEARSVLPNSLKTEVVMTANLREWRHFLSLRACGSTGKPHPQMLEVAVPLLKELKERVPVVFDDLEPMEWETVK